MRSNGVNSARIIFDEKIASKFTLIKNHEVNQQKYLEKRTQSFAQLNYGLNRKLLAGIE